MKPQIPDSISASRRYKHLGHLPGDNMSEPPTQNFWERVNNLALIRFLLLFASGWALILLLDYFQNVIVIFSLAAVFAFLLSYPVQWLHRFLPRGLAVSLIFLISLLMVGGFTVTVGFAILSQGQQLFEGTPNFLNSLTPLLERLENYLRSRHLQVDIRAVEEPLRNQALAFIGASFVSSTILLTNFVNFILIEVVAFFMLLNGEKLWGFALKLVPKHLQSRFTVIVERNFLGFFRGQLLLSLFFSAATFIVFLILKVPFALILAVIGGVFQIIPGIGSTLGLALICLILLPQSGWLAFNVFIASIVIQQIKDNLLAPRIMQNSLNINPVVVFFALLVGYRLAGLLGIFLATPIAGVVVSLFEIEDMKAISSDVT